MTHLTKPPCKDCEERIVGCHGSCERYLAYRKDVSQIQERRAQANKEQGIYVEQILRRAKLKGKTKHGKQTKRSGLS